MEDSEWINTVFFGEIVECYMLADLEKIQGNFDPSNECGNCNFPLALQIFSCIEFIGWLISNPKNSLTNTSDNIYFFISYLFSDKSRQQVKEISKFIKIFRHGLSHEYFAKSAGVSRGGKDLLSIDIKREILVLDSEVLLKEFKSSIYRLRNIVAKDSAIAHQIRTRYLEIQKNNSLVTTGIINKSQDRNTVTTSSSLQVPTYPSNASVAPSVTLPPQIS
jgi:hypothetical protein